MTQERGRALIWGDQVLCTEFDSDARGLFFEDKEQKP